MRVYWYWPFARSEEVALAEAMVDIGVDLTVDVVDRPGAPPDRRVGGLTIRRRLPEVAARRLWTPGWAADRASVYARRASRRRRALHGGGFDLAHILFLNAMSDGLDPTLRRRSHPLVVSVHDVVPHHRRLPRAVERRLLARQYDLADRYVVHDEWLARELERQFGVEPHRVRTIPLPVYPPPSTGVPPAERFEVLCFGTLRANKGIDVLLDAIASLRGRDDIRFRFAGRGVESVMESVSAASAAPNVSAELGWISPDRKHELYSRARLVVLPYRTFTSQSAVLHDAYGYGLPVVATDVGALGPSVRRDGTGWVIPPGDAGALAAAIAAAADDPAGWQRRAEASRAVAARQTPEAVAARLGALYGELLEG